MILLVHSALRHTFAVKLKHHLYLRLFLSSTDSIQAFALPSPAPATHTLTSRQGLQWPPSCCISGHSWSTSPSTSLHMDTATCPLLLASLSSPGFLGIPWLGFPPFSLLPVAFSLGYPFPSAPCFGAQSLDLFSIYTQLLSGHKWSLNFKYHQDAEDFQMYPSSWKPCLNSRLIYPQNFFDIPTEDK